MAKVSAGILLYRRASSNPASLEVLLVHPGGPFWARKDLGAWSIPKGEPEPDEDLLDAARREFAEETGATVDGNARALLSVQQSGGKTVHAWAVEGDFDPAQLNSNTCMLEWPRGSGRMQEIPEVDRAEWFSLEEAKRRINPAQVALIERLEGLGGLRA